MAPEQHDQHVHVEYEGKSCNRYACLSSSRKLSVSSQEVGMTTSIRQTNRSELRQQQSNHDDRIVYVGKFGLRHRLSKMSAAYHLGQQLNVTSMEVHWGVCDDVVHDNQHNESSSQSIFDFWFPSIEHSTCHHKWPTTTILPTTLDIMLLRTTKMLECPSLSTIKARSNKIMADI